MRVAALYDVHAMPWALEAVLAEVDADAIVFGGDYLYGPCPRETVALIRSLDAQVVRGNCEDLARNGSAAAAPGDLEWLQSLPLTVDVDGVLYCHAAPDDNTPITTPTRRTRVAATFAGHTGTIVIGHTHHQFDRRVGELRIVNAGSVGMAYEGDVAAYWTLVEDGEPVRCARRSTSSGGSRDARERLAEGARVRRRESAGGRVARRGDRVARERRR